jgi:hypothetical protein
MRETNYLWRFNKPAISPLLIRAAKVETHGEHLVFLRSGGQACGLFLREIVKDWFLVDALVPMDIRGRADELTGLLD